MLKEYFICMSVQLRDDIDLVQEGVVNKKLGQGVPIGQLSISFHFLSSRSFLPLPFLSRFFQLFFGPSFFLSISSPSFFLYPALP